MRIIILVCVFIVIQHVQGTSHYYNLMRSIQRSTPITSDVVNQPSDEYSSQMMNAPVFGLPKCSRCQNIAIIGGGIAGLTAAIELALSGHRITIYEADERIGGRILTYRKPNTNFVTELGAMRLPLLEHKLLNFYVKERYNLPTRRFISYDPNAYVFINNVLKTVEQTEANPNVFNFNLTPEESKLTVDQMWERATRPLIDMIEKEGWDAFVQKWSSYSVENYLSSLNLSRDAINYMSLMLNLETNLHTALTESIADMLILSDKTEFYHIIGGNDRLTNAMKDECLSIPDGRCTIFYNHRIVSVTLNNNPPYNAIMEWRSNDSFISHITPNYDAVIVATTAPAAELIQFKNRGLFIDKYRSLRQVYYDCASKVALYFNESWWKHQGIAGGRSVTDLPIRFVYYHNFDTSDAKGATIIASYTWSQDSLLWQTLADPVALQVAVDNVDMLHSSVNVSKFFRDGVTKHWCADPYSHGAFVLFTPNQDIYLKKYLQQSVRNVHFIGEHTSSVHAWIEGSLLSALRVSLVLQEEFFDVAIVGGGPIGLATAISLVNRNSSLRVVVIEKNEIGNSQGSSGSSDTRQFRQMYSEKYLGELAMMSVEFWRQLEADAGLASGTLLNVNNGYLFYGDYAVGETTEGNLEDIEKTCLELNMNCELLNSSGLRQRFPFFGISSTYKGIYHKNSGYINVTAMMNALYKLAMQKNVMIRTNEEFLGLDQTIPETSSFIRLFTNRGSLNATKVIFAPGPFARNISEKLGFVLNMTLWELPTFYFKLKTNNFTIPTWFAFGSDLQSLYYGFDKESSDRPGYIKISPDFISNMSHPLLFANDRTNVIDQWLFNKTQSWVASNMPFVDPNNYQIAPLTCLASFVPDNGFIIDYLPKQIRYHDKIIMYAAGWGMKFVPLWADLLTDLVLHPGSNKYQKYMDNFSFSIPRRWSLNASIPLPSKGHLLMADRTSSLYLMITTFIFVIIFFR